MRTSGNSYSNYTLASMCQLHHHQQEERHGNVAEMVTFKMLLHQKKKKKSPEARGCSSLQQHFHDFRELPTTALSPSAPLCAGWHRPLLLEHPQQAPASATSSRLAPLSHPPSLELSAQENPAQPSPALPARDILMLEIHHKYGFVSATGRHLGCMCQRNFCLCPLNFRLRGLLSCLKN